MLPLQGAANAQAYPLLERFLRQPPAQPRTSVHRIFVCQHNATLLASATRQFAAPYSPTAAATGSQGCTRSGSAIAAPAPPAAASCNSPPAVEGMNNKIKSIRHRSFGFRTAENCIAAIYHCCARLPLPENFNYTFGTGAKKGKGRYGSLNQNLPGEIVGAYQRAGCGVRPADVICIQQTARWRARCWPAC